MTIPITAVTDLAAAEMPAAPPPVLHPHPKVW
jgi:hypothetical protein